MLISYIPKVYTASKIHHWKMWKSYAERFAGRIEFTARWINGRDAPELSSDVWSNEQKQRKWIYNVQDVCRSDFVIAYRTGEDTIRGTLFECGAAVATGKPVLAVGMLESDSWQHHPLVFPQPDIESAFGFIIGE